MKKFFKRLLLVTVGFFAVLPLGAQDPDMAQVEQMLLQPMPVDQNVRIGVLPNGLTYYIRHNEKPKGQADFYIAQKVGSILEEDNQRGLAHFLEHMCFNGTENFPGNQIVEWCEKNGIKFGANLNAYTSIDETVYNIANVPTANVSTQDSVLLILHDWADGLLLDPKEIDKERGVIHQEWRSRNVGQQRILENILPTIYPNSRYGYRMPIGTMEVVDNFPPQALRDYYEAWYRPDQQGIIVVGDIDVDRIENKIKEIFSPIKMPENPKERVYYPVEDNPGTIFAIGSDPEMTMAMGLLSFKNDALPREMNNTMQAYTMDLTIDLITSMLNSRLQEIANKPNAPFSSASVGYDDFLIAKTKKSLDLQVIPNGDDLVGAYQAAYRELLRAAKHGFAKSEIDRAIREYQSRVEKRYNNRDNTENGTYVRSYVRNFVDNRYMPPIEMEYQMSMMLGMTPAEAFNAVLPELISNDNRVVTAFLPQKDGFKIPTNDEIAAALAAVDVEEIEPYVDETKSEPLIPVMPTPGSITSVSKNAAFDAEVWTLSNGAKVIVKPTTFKNDEILFAASAVGKGISDLPDAMANSIIAYPLFGDQNGLGSYTNSDLQKYLQGKQAAVSFSCDDYTRSLNGSSTVKDLPTLMELIYMTFMDYQFDADEFVAIQNTMSNILANQESAPNFAFSKNLLKELFKSPKKQMYSAEVIKNANREDMIKIAHDAMSNAADFTFYFVGNVNLETLKPLVEQYIASLPGDKATATNKVVFNDDVEVITGKGIHSDKVKMETPQAFVAVVMAGAMPYNMTNQKMASIASQILSARLLKTVREEEGAVYSIQAIGGMDELAKYPVVFQIPFPLDPAKTSLVLGMIEKEINNMTKNITDEELNKVKEYLVKAYTENKEKNSSWLSAMKNAEISGVDVFNGNIEAVNQITPKQVAKWMKDFVKQGNYQVIVVEPED